MTCQARWISLALGEYVRTTTNSRLRAAVGARGTEQGYGRHRRNGKPPHRWHTVVVDDIQCANGQS